MGSLAEGNKLISEIKISYFEYSVDFCGVLLPKFHRKSVEFPFLLLRTTIKSLLDFSLAFAASSRPRAGPLPIVIKGNSGTGKSGLVKALCQVVGRM